MNHAERPTLIVSRGFQGGAHRGTLPARLFGKLIVWNERQRQRHQLRDLDDRDLLDIGLTRSEVEREYRKPFWRG